MISDFEDFFKKESKYGQPILMDINSTQVSFNMSMVSDKERSMGQASAQ